MCSSDSIELNNFALVEQCWFLQSEIFDPYRVYWKLRESTFRNLDDKVWCWLDLIDYFMYVHLTIHFQNTPMLDRILRSLKCSMTNLKLVLFFN
jgi:hypothetical protein